MKALPLGSRTTWVKSCSKNRSTPQFQPELFGDHNDHSSSSSSSSQNPRVPPVFFIRNGSIPCFCCRPLRPIGTVFRLPWSHHRERRVASGSSVTKISTMAGSKPLMTLRGNRSCLDDWDVNTPVMHENGNSMRLFCIVLCDIIWCYMFIILHIYI